MKFETANQKKKPRTIETQLDTETPEPPKDKKYQTQLRYKRNHTRKKTPVVKITQEGIKKNHKRMYMKQIGIDIHDSNGETEKVKRGKRESLEHLVVMPIQDAHGLPQSLPQLVPRMLSLRLHRATHLPQRLNHALDQ